jgi:O-antigen/teichoic acid export membrane protein
MSRLKKFAHSLASGYLQIGVNILYTLASVPLALHYLSTEQFGLWQVAVTAAGYLMLIDFGMTGAAARILMDHKDDPAGGAYGSVVKISIVVFLIQGIIIAVAGVILSFWLPQLMGVPQQFHRPLFFLVAGQCVLQGVFFVTRVFWNLGIAHQRYDLYNYAQIGILAVQFGALWLAFHRGIGIYSVLAASAAGSVVNFCCGWITAVKFQFFPPAGRWGKFDFKLFKEIFFFGSDQFLMALGAQLTNATQILIISHMFGLAAAAVWSVATKPFMLAQQLVGRIFAFACSPLCEMIVRGERERFLKRFRDVIIVSVSLAIFTAGGIAFCNESFLHVWTKGRIAWNPWNDLLLAIWFVTTCSTTLHVSMTTLIKQIGTMRYVYFFEGLIFVATAIFLGFFLGISGIILAAIVANILCSGIFGIRRTVKYFQVSAAEVLIGWMAGPMKYFLLFGLILTGCRFLTEPLSPIVRLFVNAAIAGIAGLWLLLQVGLTAELRAETRIIVTRIKTRLPNLFGS